MLLNNILFKIPTDINLVKGLRDISINCDIFTNNIKLLNKNIKNNLKSIINNYNNKNIKEIDNINYLKNICEKVNKILYHEEDENLQNEIDNIIRYVSNNFFDKDNIDILIKEFENKISSIDD